MHAGQCPADGRIAQRGEPPRALERESRGVFAQGFDEQQLGKLCEYRAGGGPVGSDFLRSVLEGAGNPVGTRPPIQRDLLDLTLIEAALRGGIRPLASALARERIALRPESPLSQLFIRRSEALGAMVAAA